MIHKISYKIGLGLKHKYFDLKTSAEAGDFPVAVRYADRDPVFRVGINAELESEHVKIFETKKTKRLTKIYSNSTNILITDIVVDGQPCFWKWPKTEQNLTTTSVSEDADFYYFSEPGTQRLEFKDRDGKVVKVEEDVQFHRVYILKDFTHLSYIYEKDSKWFTYKKDGNRLVLTVNSTDVTIEAPRASIFSLSLLTKDPVNQRCVSYWPFITGPFDYSGISPNTTRTIAKKQLISEAGKVNFRAMNIVLESVTLMVKDLSDDSILDSLSSTELVNGFNPQTSTFDLSFLEIDPAKYYVEAIFDSVSYKNQFALFDYRNSGIIDFDEQSQNKYNCHLFFTKDSGIVFRAIAGNKIINATADQVVLGSRDYGWSEGGFSEDGFSGIVPDEKKKEYFLKEIIETTLDIDDQYIQGDNYITKDMDVDYDTIILNNKSADRDLETQHILTPTARLTNFRQGAIINFGIGEHVDVSSAIPANNHYYFRSPELEIKAFDVSETEIKFEISSLMACIDTDSGLVDSGLVMDSGHSLYDRMQAYDDYVDYLFGDTSLDITDFSLIGDDEVIDTGISVRISSDLQFIHYRFDTEELKQSHKYYTLAIGGSVSSYGVAV